MRLRVHPLTAALAVISCFTGDIKLIAASYAVMTGHELSHLAAAKLIGLKAESFTFMPFGVNLRLKNKIIHSLAEEIILYAAGPLFNGVFAIISALLGYDMIYKMNTALFIMNILPIMPLDGGMIMFRIFASRFGNTSARRILNIVSFSLASLFTSFAFAAAINGEINLSMVIMALFLLGNIVTSKEKYNADFVAAMSGAEKKTNNVKIVLLENESDTLPAIKAVSPMYTVFGAVLDDENRVKRFMTESEMMDAFSLIEKKG